MSFASSLDSDYFGEAHIKRFPPAKNFRYCHECKTGIDNDGPLNKNSVS